jgi:alpha-tubulin suppressor-like RCC1 family protein
MSAANLTLYTYAQCFAMFQQFIPTQFPSAIPTPLPAAPSPPPQPTRSPTLSPTKSPVQAAYTQCVNLTNTAGQFVENQWGGTGSPTTLSTTFSAGNISVGSGGTFLQASGNAASRVGAVYRLKKWSGAGGFKFHTRIQRSNRGAIGAGLVSVSNSSDPNLNPSGGFGTIWSTGVSEFSLNDGSARFAHGGGLVVAGTESSPTFVWIDYDSSTQVVSGYTSSTSTKPGSPAQTTSINLNAYGSSIHLGIYMSGWTAGFHGGTVQAMAFECNAIGCCVDTRVPTNSPTQQPTKSPTRQPTNSPSQRPSLSPTRSPTLSPTPSPTAPTRSPTASPTRNPTASPTRSPTASPVSIVCSTLTPNITDGSCGTTTGICSGGNLCVCQCPTANATNTTDCSPRPSVGFRDVEANDFGTCAIRRADSTMWCTGLNSLGQLGTGSNLTQTVMQPVLGALSGVAVSQICLGQMHTCAIRASDSRLFCWGRNIEGQVGTGTLGGAVYSPTIVVAPLSTTPIQSVSCGHIHTCAVSSDTQKSYCWGSAGNGRLGNGLITPNVATPFLITAAPFTASNTSFIQACGAHTCAATTGPPRLLYCWGDRTFNQVGNGAVAANQLTPVQPAAPISGADVSSVACTSVTTWAILGNNSFGYVFGRDFQGRAGIGSTVTANIAPPTNLAFPLNNTALLKFATGTDSAQQCAIRNSDRRAFCWGSDAQGGLGNSGGTVSADTGTPQSVEGPIGATEDPTNTILDITIGLFHTCAITTRQSLLYCWGDNRPFSPGISYGALGIGGSTNFGLSQVDGPQLVVGMESGVTDVVAFHRTACATRNNVTYCWGRNNEGQCGVGTTESFVVTPKAVTGSLNLRFRTESVVSDGTHLHRCALRASDNNVMCWGSNSEGQAQTGGVGGTILSPALVAGANVAGSAFLGAGSGSFHSQAIRASDRTVWCWGRDIDGQCGTGSTTAARTVPVALGAPLSGVSIFQLSVGGYHGCVIVNSTRFLYCYGFNVAGQLGDGTTTSRSSPTLVAGEILNRRVKLVACGTFSTCATLELDSRLYCWGENTRRGIGALVTATTVLLPLVVAGTFYDNGALEVSVGFGGATGDRTLSGTGCAIRATDSNVFCWGNNEYSTVGSGHINTPVSVPEGVGGALEGVAVSRISIGYVHACSIVSATGALYCWGYGGNGQVGNGYIETALLPLPVSTSHMSTANVLCDYFPSTTSEPQACGCSAANLVPTRVPTRVPTQRPTRSPTTASCASQTPNVNTSQCSGSCLSGEQCACECVLGSDNNTFVTFCNRSESYGFSAVSTFRDTSCAIRRSDSTIFCWGRNSAAQLGQGFASGTPIGIPTPIGGLLAGVAVSQISVGNDHACAIRASNSLLYCWGSNANGQVGINSTATPQVSPVLVTGLLSGVAVRKVSCGRRHTCALQSNGSLYCWGENTAGQLGHGGLVQVETPKLTIAPLNVNVSDVTTGHEITCAIRASDSLIHCFGRGTEGQIGTGATTATNPVPLAIQGFYLGNASARAVSCSFQSCCALRTNDSYAFCWGLNTLGRLGDGSTTQRLVPARVQGPLLGEAVASIKAGAFHSCAILAKDNTLFCWGSDASGQLGDAGGTLTSSAYPKEVQGVIGDDVYPYHYIVDFAIGESYTCAITTRGSELFCWGQTVTTGIPQLGTDFPLPSGEVNTPRVVPGFESGVREVKVTYHVHAVRSDNTTWCWGSNVNGECGDGDTDYNIAVPNLIEELAEFRFSESTQSIGGNHACAIRSVDSTLWCWGLNTNGQLGTGDLNSRYSPARVVGVFLSGTASVVVAGDRHTCALLSSTSVMYCWGDNTNGATGINSVSGNSLTPTAVAAPLSGVSISSITTGEFISCAITNATRFGYCWGNNAEGGVGINSTVSPISIPTLIGSAALNSTNLTRITGMHRGACAIRANDSLLFCWGINANAQVGTGATSTPVLAPVPVVGVFSSASVTTMCGAYDSTSTSNGYACAVRANDSNVFCWGYNAAGQVGNGVFTTPQLTPQAVGGALLGAAVAQISCGRLSACAIRSSDRALYCWGSTGLGALGIGMASVLPEPTLPVSTANMTVAYTLCHDYINGTLNARCACPLSNTVPTYLPTPMPTA